MEAEPTLRIVVFDENGEPSVYEVSKLKINEPFVVYSDTGGVVVIEPPAAGEPRA